MEAQKRAKREQEKLAKKTEKKKEQEGTSHHQPKQQPPNKILFVENLPETTTDVILQGLFQQFPGFKEVRMANAKGGKVAFVEFDSDSNSSVAMSSLQHFKITPNNLMVITYAKRG